MRFGRDSKTAHAKKTTQSVIRLQRSHPQPNPRYPHPRVRIPSTRSAPRLRPRDRSRALASTRSDACTLPPSPPPRTARIRPRAPTIRRRKYSARMTSRARHRWMPMRSRSRRRTIDRPRRCARRRRSRCDDANACDEISIARCDRAYLWKVSSDRAAKCRSSRDSHRAGLSFSSSVGGGRRAAGFSRENYLCVGHVVCAYSVESVCAENTCNFCHDTPSRARGGRLCIYHARRLARVVCAREGECDRARVVKGID